MSGITTTTLHVELTYLEPVLGTVPKSKEVYAKYIAAKAASLDDAEEEVESVQDAEEKGWTGFHEEAGKPFVYDYYLKGCLKDVANVLKEQIGVKNLKSKVENVVFVTPRKVFFRAADGGKLKIDELERPLRAQTAQGPRVTLARSDMILNGKLSYDLTLLANHEVTPTVIRTLLDYGRFRGTGQWRNGGWGRYEAVLTTVKDGKVVVIPSTR